MKLRSKQPNVELVRIVLTIVYALKIIGLAPFSLRTKTWVQGYCSNRFISVFRFSKIGVAYNCLLLVMIQVLALHSIPILASSSYQNSSVLTVIMDVSLCLASWFTSNVVIIYWAFRQENAACIMNKLLEIERVLVSLNYGKPVSSKNLFVSFALHAVLNFVSWIIVTITQISLLSEAYLAPFYYVVLGFVVSSYVLEYFIAVGFLFKVLEQVNKKLSQLVEFSSFGSRAPFLQITSSSAYRRQLVNLHLLCAMRKMLYEVSQEIADFFLFPVLPSIGCLFLSFVYNIYYLISPVFVLNGDFTLNVIFNAIAWIFCSIYSITLLSLNVTKTLNEAKLTGPIIHKLLSLPMTQETHTKLKEFSLQLLHEHVGFTACGFFTLDSTMLCSILGATATYIVILIQFQESGHTSNNTSLFDSDSV